MNKGVLAACALLLVISFPAVAGKWSGYAAMEYRGFPHSPLDPAQHGDNVSLAVEPEYTHIWNGGRDVFAFVPFARVDQHDDQRTHWDIRELAWVHARPRWELRLGVRKVFWGVAESRHLVDIINQTDLVENIDEEDKLGQPMVNFALVRDWGTLDLFVLTGFRPRTFAGREGRPRIQPRVDPELVVYESGAEKGHIDLAVRWSRSVGAWDLGLSHFHGTGRDPSFAFTQRPEGESVLVPIYEQIDQSGLDVQATTGSWLWKLEAMRRSGQGNTFFGATAGFEYTFYGVFNSAADIGILAEYLYGNRDAPEITAFKDDLFGGLRITMNDVQSTEVLAGCVVDPGDAARFCNVEASRRIGDNWVLSLELRTFSNISADDPFFGLSRDDYLQLEFAYHF